MKKNRKKDEFLTQLKKIPIVQSACEKVGLSRNTVYRWKKEDPKFKVEMDLAMSEGEDLVNDVSEHQLLNLIQQQDWHAISFWLRHRNPKFRDKVDINATVKNESEKLTSQDEKLIEEAIKRLSE